MASYIFKHKEYTAQKLIYIMCPDLVLVVWRWIGVYLGWSVEGVGIENWLNHDEALCEIFYQKHVPENTTQHIH